jgi:hypothetical protein
MTDHSERLRATIAQLRHEIQSAEAIDSQVASHVEQAIAELESALEQQGVSADHPSLIDRFKEAARHFEQSHPTVSGTLAQLIDVLGRMGI